MVCYEFRCHRFSQMKLCVCVSGVLMLESPRLCSATSVQASWLFSWWCRTFPPFCTHVYLPGSPPACCLRGCQSLQHVPRVYFLDVSCNLAYLFISSSCFHSILYITTVLTSQTYFFMIDIPSCCLCVVVVWWQVNLTNDIWFFPPCLPGRAAEQLLKKIFI